MHSEEARGLEANYLGSVLGQSPTARAIVPFGLFDSFRMLLASKVGVALSLSSAERPE
jgi:hypothetical protein